MGVRWAVAHSFFGVPKPYNFVNTPLKKKLLSVLVKIFVSLILILGLAGCLTYFNKFNRYKWLTIVFTGDINGKLFPLKIKNKKDKELLTGGISLISTAIKEIKSQCIYRNRSYLILDSGDMFNFAVYNNAEQRMVLTDFINTIGYDAIALGNHELDSGIQNFISISNALNVPFVCSNIEKNFTTDTITKDFANIVCPYIDKEIDSYKIGIVGFITEDLINILPVQYRNEIKVSSYKILNKTINNLRSGGCDLIILLSHNGFDPKYPEKSPDYKIAGMIDGIDIILSGHREKGVSQTFQHPVTKTYICSNYGNGATITKIDLYIDTIKAQIMRFNQILLNVNSDNYIQDTAFELCNDSIIHHENLEKGFFDISIKFSKLNQNENNTHRVITEILRRVYSADCSILNKGFIRGQFVEKRNYISDIANIIPHNNYAVKFFVKGSQMYKLAELVSYNKEKLSISGLNIIYSISPENIYEITGLNNSQFDLNRYYKIVTSDFCYKKYFDKSDLQIKDFKQDTRTIIESFSLFLPGKEFAFYFEKNIKKLE